MDATKFVPLYEHTAEPNQTKPNHRRGRPSCPSPASLSVGVLSLLRTPYVTQASHAVDPIVAVAPCYHCYNRQYIPNISQKYNIVYIPDSYSVGGGGGGGGGCLVCDRCPGGGSGNDRRCNALRAT